MPTYEQGETGPGTDGPVEWPERGRDSSAQRRRAAHARPEPVRHELPTAIPVGEYRVYHHGGRLEPDDPPPPRSDRPHLLTTGESLAYDVDARETGPHLVCLRVAAEDTGTVGVAVDGEPRTRAVVEPTGGWDRWAELWCQVDLARGEGTLELVALSGGWRLGGLRVE
ncbi:carbohydrate-binding protein [Haloarcula litorea]|uniref:carbohydrate-binding protein n=1 Tax=Haloarcula litorea TaxID=3032579 RepID=UPI0023E8D291|nr:carbohydrate-binding protein [Halomicroarcula sp. GDY20]